MVSSDPWRERRGVGPTTRNRRNALFAVVTAREATAWLKGLTFDTVLNMEGNFKVYGPFSSEAEAESFAGVIPKVERARVIRLVNPEWVDFLN